MMRMYTMNESIDQKMYREIAQEHLDDNVKPKLYLLQAVKNHKTATAMAKEIGVTTPSVYYHLHGRGSGLGLINKGYVKRILGKHDTMIGFELTEKGWFALKYLEEKNNGI